MLRTAALLGVPIALMAVIAATTTGVASAASPGLVFRPGWTMGWSTTTVQVFHRRAVVSTQGEVKQVIVITTSTIRKITFTWRTAPPSPPAASWVMRP